MRIRKAKHLGMCFGVRDAIDLALARAKEQPLTILGDLVHNETVLEELKQRGIRIAQGPENIRTAAVMVTAHGASQKAMSGVAARGFQLSEATCPLVHYAHRAVAQLVQGGYFPVIVGKRDHVEVRGLTEDLDRFEVVLSEADIERLEFHPRFGVAAQTTQPIDKVLHLVNLLRERFPAAEVKYVDTVCRPTKQRQSAAIEIARGSDVVIVIGGKHSNNTRELVQTCGRFCARVYHVQTAAELRPEWFLNAETVGITAGTSTPDSSIDEVEQWIQQHCENKRSELVPQLQAA